MKYSPVIITTLCRFDYFKNCIESLLLNEEAKNTELYIGLDYPTKKEHWDGYNKILEYCKHQISGFSKLHLIVREYNFGPDDNAFDLFKIVEKTHDRFIFSEDDNVFSKSFLKYMNIAIEKSENNDDIFVVCGYSYPILWKEDSSVIKMQTLVSAWGYGSTFIKYRKFCDEYNMDLLNKNFNLKAIRAIKKISPKNYCYYVNKVWAQAVAYHDTDMQLYQILTNRYCLMPRKSLVRNRGWDGSGEHCHIAKYDFASQPIDLTCDGIDKEELVCDEYFVENDYWANLFLGKVLPNPKIEYFKNEIQIIMIKAKLVGLYKRLKSLILMKNR